MDDTRASRIRDKLRRLREGDPLLQLREAPSHRYELGPRLSEAQLAAFEAAYGVVLPEEYRWFLRELGDAGAGPRGLRALTSQGLDLELASPSRLWWTDAPPDVSAPPPGAAGAAVAADTADAAAAASAAEAAVAAAAGADAAAVTASDGDDPAAGDASVDLADSWSPGEPLRAYLDRLRARGERPRFHEDDAAVMARLCAAYEAEPEVRDLDTEAFEAREPPAPDDDAEEDRPGDATLGFLGEQRTLFVERRLDSFLRGTLSIVKLPCGYEELLVVSGAERGHIWTDSITISRTATSFLDWYEAWLDEKLDELGALPPPPAPAIADWARDLVAAARVRGEDPEPLLLAFHGAYGTCAGLWPVVLEILEEHGTPSSPLAQCRADALLELGRFAEAERWYREAEHGLLAHERHDEERRFSSSDPVPYSWFVLRSPGWGLARSLVAQGRREEALHELERLPPKPYRFIQAGLVAYDLRRFDEVVRLTSVARFLAHVTGDRDNEASALINRGNALLRLERYADARADYARALDEPCCDPLVYYNLACLEAAVGDHAAAMAHVEAAIAAGVGPELFDEDDLVALRDDPAHHARFVELAARAWWRRS